MAKTWTQILPQHAVQVGNTLADRAAEERQNGKTVYPTQENIFKALQLTQPDNVKVVILGQDPYHQPGQAMGLSFSTPDINPTNNKPLAPPPSLINIYQELCRELSIDYSSQRISNNLTPWAEQGVLLLNASLTVEHSKPASHSQWGWNILTSAVVEQCLKLPQPVVFLLWGAHAFKVMDEAISRMDKNDIKDKYLLKSTHPSPFSANRASNAAVAFMGCGHFMTANEVLGRYDIPPIDWLNPLLKR